MTRTKAAGTIPDSGRTEPALRGCGAGHPYVSLLGLRTFDTAGLRERVREGLAYRSWTQFLQNTRLPKDMALHVVGIAPRTIARRKAEGRLHPDESDRLVRAARIFSQAVALFVGDDQAAREWLSRPQPALGGSTPVDYAASEIGAREVENLMGRLEHGIPT